MRLNLKRLALASVLACSGSAALAVNYFFVTPKSHEMAKAAPVSLALGAHTLPAAVVGIAYSGIGYDLAPLLSISGDPALNPALATFAVTAGNLPAGLTLSAAGVLAGIPTAAGGGQIQVTASYKNAAGSQTYTVLSVNLVVVLAAAALPAGTVGLVYNNGAGFDFASLVSVPADASFNASQTTFKVTAGELPAGLVLSSAGKLTGTPVSAVASAPFTVTATYKSSTGERSYSASTVNLTVTLSTASLPIAAIGSSYNTSGYDFASNLSVVGDPSYNASLATFELTSGNMPAGMTLSSTGKLTGTPTVVSASTTLQVAATYKSNTRAQSYNWIAFNQSLITFDSNSFDAVSGVSPLAPVQVSPSTFTLSPVVRPGSSGYSLKSTPSSGTSLGYISYGSTLAVGTGDFTLEGWGSRDTGSGGASAGLAYMGGTGAGSVELLIDELGTKNMPSFGIAGVLYATNDVSIPLNTWVKLALTRKAGIVRFWVNDVQVSISAYNGAGYPATGVMSLTVPGNVAASALVVANRTGSGTAGGANTRQWRGYIDEVRFTGQDLYTP